MKKMIMAVAIICAAVSANAAVANWGVGASNIYNGKGDSAAKVAAGTTMYMFDAGVISQSQLFDLFAADLALDMTTVSGYAATVATSGAGVAAATSVKFAYGEQSSSGDTKTYSFFFAIVDNDTIFLSKDISKAANGSDTAASLSYGSQAPTTGATSKSLPTEGFVAAGQWAQAVPEPTSGFLLLLGMAGLALKRKQA